MNTTRGASELDGERRIISILFCDVKGSTAAADQLDPEEWAEIMNGAFDQMMEPIYRYEGTVVRLLGDAILAYFGAPIAREDDPQRAVLAALEIQQTVQTYAASVQRQWGVSFSVRCGINTGLVVVGSVGGRQHMEYSALGDAVNLAARMEQTAQPGTVQISSATYRLVAPFFDVQDLGELELKGKEQPEHAYCVLGRRASPGSLRGLAGLQTPLIGRETEMDTLMSVLDKLQQGRGGIVFLLGDAGVGKSRLIRELESRSKDVYPTTRWYRTSSFSFEKSQPYSQVQRVLRRMCGIEGDESAEQQRQKIAQTLANMTVPQPEQTRQALETILGVEDKPNAAFRLEGEAFKGILFTTMMEFGRALSEAHPIVVVFDDMQWIDAASAGLLEHILSKIHGSPILMLCAMRPSPDSFGSSLMALAAQEFAPTFTELALQPLSDRASDELVRSLLELARLPSALHQQILDKAAGNPLYMEEVVRALIESSHLPHPNNGQSDPVGSDGMAQVPANLQTLIIARIDHLPPEARHLLLLASVIGPSFNLRVLAGIANREPAALAVHMNQMQQSGIIRQTAHAPEVEYAFVHVLVQETAYRMLLRRQRREVHGSVGETIEQLFPDRLEENAVLLAYHYDTAAMPARAVRYYRMAGDTAFRLYSLKETIAHFSRALELAQIPENEVDGETIKHLFLFKGRSLELDTQLEAALATYDEMEALAHQRGDRDLELAAMVARLPLYTVPTSLVNPKLGRSLGEKALLLARELKDQAAEAKLLWNLSNASAQDNDLVMAVEYGERSLALAEQLGLREQLALTLTDLAVFCYGMSGKLQQAKDSLLRAAQICRELNDLPMLANDLSSLSMACVYMGEYEQAIDFSAEALAISESINNLWGQSYSRYKVGNVYWEQGNPDRALDIMQTSVRIGRQAGFLASQVEPPTDMAAIYRHLGVYDRGLELIRTVLEIPLFQDLPDFAYIFATQAQLLLSRGDLDAAASVIETFKNEEQTAWPTYRSAILMAEAELCLAQGDYPRARDQAEIFAEESRRFGLRPRIPAALHLQGQALTAMGESDAARRCLTEARSEAEAIGSRWLVWQILAALAEIESDPSAAETLRSEARHIVEYIAQHISEAELRSSFLSLPNVMKLYGDAAE